MIKEQLLIIMRQSFLDFFQALDISTLNFRSRSRGVWQHFGMSLFILIVREFGSYWNNKILFTSYFLRMDNTSVNPPETTLPV